MFRRVEDSSKSAEAYDKIYADPKAEAGQAELNVETWGQFVFALLRMVAGDIENPIVDDIGAGPATFYPVAEAALRNPTYRGHEVSQRAIDNALSRHGDKITMELADVLQLTQEQKEKLAESDVLLSVFIGPSVGVLRALEVFLEIRALAEKKGKKPPSIVMVDRVYTEDQLEPPKNILTQIRYFFSLRKYAAQHGFTYSPNMFKIMRLMKYSIFNQAAYRKLDETVHKPHATGTPEEFSTKVTEILDAAGVEYDLGMPAENVLLVIK